ncbi:MAG: methyltransferase domain-containing protein [Chloroflexota bacterium]
MSTDRPSPRTTPICDYEGSTYRTDFWENQGREYEDLAERIALKHLIPSSGKYLLDIGAGFGRLSNLYTAYDTVFLLDYSTSLLREAQKQFGHTGRYRYVAANFYHLPFAGDLIDTVVMVRVLHHAQDVASVLAEIAHVLQPMGSLVLEYANKRHIKAILRYLTRRQDWNPFDHQPLEFVPLNFDFHPAYICQHLRHEGFEILQERAVSSFRLPALKRNLAPHWLATLDSLLQRPLASLKLTPSVFLHARLHDNTPSPPPGTIFCCPACRSEELIQTHEALTCQNCSQAWPIVQGIYDFRWPLPSDAV